MSQPGAALFPLFLDLRGRRVLVVGGGEVAARKVAALLDSGAAVVMVAPAITPALAALAQANRLAHIPTAFAPEQLDGRWLVRFANGEEVERYTKESAEGEKQAVLVKAREEARAQLPDLLLALVSGGG